MLILWFPLDSVLTWCRTFSLFKREIKPTDFTYSYYLQAVMGIIKKTVCKFYFIFPYFASYFIAKLVINDKVQGDLNQVIIILY